MPRLDRPLRRRGLARSTAFALLAVAAGCSTGTPTTEPPATTSAATSTTPPTTTLATCGDGVCSHDDDEACETCPGDCGACPVCGNGQCETATGLESCESCPADCGACSDCGDGACSADSGEDCSTCADDCGVCPGCGDGACAEAETCESCAADCGVCPSCGDGSCDGKEDCHSCAKDCGACKREGCVQGNFAVYYGGLHAHTHISDGQGTAAQAFAHASQVTKPAFDFLWLSDHHNGITPAEWKACRAAADKYNVPGRFATGCGWEETILDAKDHQIGHFNTLFVDKLRKMPHTIPALYDALETCGDCLGQWNHPPWPGTLHDYAYYPVAKDRVRLIEFNGHGAWDDKMNAYFTALQKGWRVSPSWNEDNHHGGWGDTTHATMVWAPKLNRLAVRAAVYANRTAATEDDTASLKMLADGACWMGSALKGLDDTTITVDLADAQKGDDFGLVTLFGPGHKAIDTADCKGKNPCHVSFPLKLTKRTHVVAVARQKDGDVIVSAPIWFEP
jgi:hypothetical protein